MSDDMFYEKLKKPWNSGLRHLARLLQSMGATDEKQGRLTEALEDFEEFTDRLRDVLHDHESGLSSLEKFEERLNKKVGELEASLEILQNAHLNYVRSDPAEYKERHWFTPRSDSLVTAGPAEPKEREPLEKKLLHLGAELEDIIGLLLRQDPPDKWDYYAIEFVVERLAKVAGMEVV